MYVIKNKKMLRKLHHTSNKLFLINEKTPDNDQIN